MMMPERNHEQLQITEDEDDERSKVGSETYNLCEQVGDGMRCMHIRMAQAGRKADATHTVRAVV